MNAKKRFGGSMNPHDNNRDSFSPVGRPMKKKKKRMPASLTIIVGLLVFVMVLTWMYPGSDDIKPFGLLNFGTSILNGFTDAAPVIFYLFILGAFIEIMLRSQSLERAVGAVTKKLKEKILWVIPILFLFFSAGGTLYGMQEETLGFFIILVPFFVLAGFDTMTALIVVVLGTTTGFAFSIINPFAIGAAVGAVDAGGVTTLADGQVLKFLGTLPDNPDIWAWQILDANGLWTGLTSNASDNLFGGLAHYQTTEAFLTEGALGITPAIDLEVTLSGIGEGLKVSVPSFWGGIAVGEGIGTRSIFWVLATIAGATVTTWYGRRVYKNNKKSIVYDTYEADKEWAKITMAEGADLPLTKKHKAALTIFSLTFLMMILGFIPWLDILGYDGGTNGPFWWLWNQNEPLGFWYFGELNTIFLASTILLFALFRFSPKQMVATIFAGAKTMFTVGILIGVARAIALVLGTDGSGLNDLFISGLTGQLEGISLTMLLILIFLIFTVMSFAITSTSGLATALMPIMGGVVSGAAGQGPDGQASMMNAIFLYSIAIGAVNMITPSSPVLMASAEQSRVPYTKMLKIVLPYSIGVMIFAVVVIGPIAGANILSF